MLKKTLLTAAAAIAITAGATSISTPQADAGVKFNVTFGHGKHGYYGGYYGGYYEPACYWKKKRVPTSYWHYGHKHHEWVWKSYKVCY